LALETRTGDLPSDNLGDYLSVDSAGVIRF
jgi:hypothetical protein